MKTLLEELLRSGMEYTIAGWYCCLMYGSLTTVSRLIEFIQPFRA